MKVIEGHYVAEKKARFAIVVSRTNAHVTEALKNGAVDALQRHGVNPDSIEIVYVPGAFELPLAVKQVCASKRFAAVVALGCVIRGGTPHFDYVAGEAISGLTKATLEFNIPVALGVLTCDTLEQAMDRSGAKSGNKGWDAALSALEMADLLRKL